MGFYLPCHSETLADALANAYATNPTLQAQRAEQQVTDEAYVQARSGWRPSLNLEASGSYSRQPQSDPFFGTQIVSSNSGAIALTLRQTLYSGGRTGAAVRAAKNQILAGRAGLLSTEATLLANVISDYVGVLYEQRAVDIRRRYVGVLEEQLDETVARFKAGDLTKTDIAQTQTQLAAARQELISEEAELQIIRGAYSAVVGKPPGVLADPPRLPGLAANVDAAFESGEANNPDLVRAKLVEAASAERIAEARAVRRPTIAVEGSAGYVGPLTPFRTRSYIGEVAVQAVVTQALYAGGAINSAVHQAIAQNSADRSAIEIARRSVDQLVAQSWNEWLAEQQNLTIATAALESARAAAEGSQIEYRGGLRSTLDVLTAQQVLRDAELLLIQAQRDNVVAQASVLSAEGQLSLEGLIQHAELYAAATSFEQRVRATSLLLDPIAALLDEVASPSTKNPAIALHLRPMIDPTLRPATGQTAAAGVGLAAR
jgi:outer membrane protein